MLTSSSSSSSNIYIYPTDTVWGIGGSILKQDVYLKIMSIKKITHPRPVSILFSEAEEIEKYFNLPPKFSKSFFEEFFSFESTLGLPINLIKDHSTIPRWLYQESEIVAIRMLKYYWIKEIIQNVNAPIITTSLNLTDSSPILSYNEALSFKKEYAPSALIVEMKVGIENSQNNLQLSGTPSSIVYLDHQQKLKTIREGRYYKELKNLLTYTSSY
ncbi:MAG: Sua5/YciO/YrdC/YwlC family protein [Oligoflexia bacterium]|nr:Sua5/YciO/YrdC/YwlC family protein [Oligoflexia bacterium]